MIRSAEPQMQKDKVSREWIGILLIALGILCLVFPKITLTIIALLIGICFLVIGIRQLYLSVVGKADIDRATGKEVALAMVEVIFGLLFLLYPLILSKIIPWLLGLAVLLAGLYQLVDALKLRKAGARLWWMSVALAALILLAGLLMMLHTGWLAWLLGAYAIVQGIALFFDGKYASEIIYG